MMQGFRPQSQPTRSLRWWRQERAFFLDGADVGSAGEGVMNSET